MMIIAGGEPELCCRWHAKREGGVYAHPYVLRMCTVSLVQNVACTSCAYMYIGKYEKGCV